MATPIPDEQIRYDIEIDVATAIQSLKQLLSQVDGVDNKVNVFSRNLLDLSRKWNVSWNDLLNTFRKVNAELSAQGTGGTLFGNIGGKSQSTLFDMSQGYIRSAESANRYVSAVDDANVANKNFDGSIKQANQSLSKTSDNLNKAASSGSNFNNILKLIRGTLVAIAVFRVFQFIDDSIRTAIKTATEFEQSLYRIENVERILSQQGTEISVQGLLDGIKEIKKLLPIFSQAEITQEVSSIGIMTKDLGYTQDQIIALGKAIGVLNIKTPQIESLAETTQKVLTALVAPTGRGTPSLGIALNADAQAAEAVAEHLIKTRDEFDKLTDKQKDLIKLNIILKGTGAELVNIQDYLSTNSAKLQENTSAWQDLLNQIGQILLPFVPALTKSFEFLAVQMDNVKISIAGILSILGSVWVGIKLIFSGSIHSVNDFMAAVTEASRRIYKELTDMFFPENVAKRIDTATEAVKKLGLAIEDLPGLDKLASDLQNLADKATEAEAKFQTGIARDLQDFNTKQTREYEDLLRDISKVQEDSNKKLADSNKKYRNQELDAEKRFQEQLRQLREKFLFNLEDALRERDAKQVLRLQAQYQMDKQALINENALRKDNAAKQHADELSQIKQERDDRIAALQEEYKIKQQREQEDFDLSQKRKAEDHAAEMEQIKQQINDRLMEFAKAIGDEYNLNEDSVNQLYDLLKKYYGPNGYFEGLYDYSYKSLVARAQLMLAAINQIVNQSQLAEGSFQLPYSAGPGHSFGSIGGQAEGGTYFATKPTTATFGEAGPEIASFIPLRKLGNTQPMSGRLPAGANGKVDIELWLSPDLEARITNNTLKETANVFTKINRSKK